MDEIVSYRGCSLPDGWVLCPSSEHWCLGWPYREQARSHKEPSVDILYSQQIPCGSELARDKATPANIFYGFFTP
ncbi:hypothetical protein J3D49_002574 [Pseudomonas kilonensis]|nr:hypothetical protein [Pseudomonas kilonensis]